ncbi:unnamed protein product [[Candida] boidinii]|uniref:Unnamed protein product n=1 Tax=Candida boidinii TaxID=5477 RepID=A0A9W6WL28_CANBO|nr:unnamed protein product [[Candida] boidinii]
MLDGSFSKSTDLFINFDKINLSHCALPAAFLSGSTLVSSVLRPNNFAFSSKFSNGISINFFGKSSSSVSSVISGSVSFDELLLDSLDFKEPLSSLSDGKSSPAASSSSSSLSSYS